MLKQSGNMSTAERVMSALVGIALAVFTGRRTSAAARIIAGGATAAFLARAWAGHCGVKSTLQGHTSLTGGLADQWDRMSGSSRTGASGLPGSLAHAASSAAVDQSVDDSFPASDPPASHQPDEPPSNAEAKWATARAAGAVK